MSLRRCQLAAVSISYRHISPFAPLRRGTRQRQHAHRQTTLSTTGGRHTRTAGFLSQPSCYVDPQPYSEKDFERTYRWMVKWGLIGDDSSYDTLVDTRAHELAKV